MAMNAYVCPVIQPTSAMQANLSLGCTSKTYFTVRAAQSRYPPVVCTTPLGFPVDPEVFEKISEAKIN